MTQPAAAITTHDENGKQVRRYPIPSPVTGEVVELPNISSIIDTLQAFGLDGWKLRNAAVGIVHRLDLQAAIAAGHHVPGKTNRNRALNDAIDLAIQHGQTLDPEVGYLRNDFGTAIHLLDELIDQGAVPDIMSLPASVAEHAAAYAEMMTAHGIEVVESEFTVYGSAGYAGTGDRIIRFDWHTVPETLAEDAAGAFDQFDLGRGCFIADVKTGKVKKSAALQLAALANADSIWDHDAQQHRPLPDDLRRDVAFIIHQPGGAQLVPVDIEAAWPAFLGALAVKTWDETKPLHPNTFPMHQAPAGAVAAVRAQENAEAADLLADMGAPSGIPSADAYDGPCGMSDVEHERKFFRGDVRDPAQWWCSICEANYGDGAIDKVVCEHLGAMVAPSSAEPTHISDTLRQVIANIPDDPDAGTVDPDGHHLLDRQAKTAWLTKRLGDLIDTHGAELPIAWPADVPTFRAHREAGELHTVAELAAIETAINAAEREVGAPFPDPDPSSTNAKVAADDPRAVAIMERFAKLPPDLKPIVADEAAVATEGRRPSLGQWTEDDVTWCYGAVLDAEFDAILTRDAATNAAGVLVASGWDADHLLALVGNHVDAPTVWQANRLDELADAAGLDHVTFDDGRAQLTDEGRKHLEREFGGRRGVLNAAKLAAEQLGRPKPTKADDVYADVLLAAHLTLIESAPVDIEPTQ